MASGGSNKRQLRGEVAESRGSFSYSFIQPVIHSVSQSFGHSVIQAVIQSFIHSVVSASIQSFCQPVSLSISQLLIHSAFE